MASPVRSVAISANGNSAAIRQFSTSSSNRVAIEVTATTWAAATTCTLQASIDGVTWNGLIEGNTAIVFEDFNKVITLPGGLFYRIVTALFVGSAGVVFRVRSL